MWAPGTGSFCSEAAQGLGRLSPFWGGPRGPRLPTVCPLVSSPSCPERHGAHPLGWSGEGGQQAWTTRAGGRAALCICILTTANFADDRAVIKTIPKKKKCKKPKWLSEKALQIAMKRRDAKGKGEEERCQSSLQMESPIVSPCPGGGGVCGEDRG